MATGADFAGANTVFKGGADNVNDIDTFKNRECVVTCWELTDAEIAEIIITKRVWVSQFFGGRLVPHYVSGSKEEMRAMVAEYGGAW